MDSIKYYENDYYKHLVRKNEKQLDLFLCQCGSENCSSKHGFGPAVRDHYLIHFILEGEGYYIVKGKRYKLRKNQGFLICPGELTYYEASESNPWSYIWVGFNGLKAKNYLNDINLNEENLVFEYNKDGNNLKYYIDTLLNLKNMSFHDELKTEGLLYLFLAELVENSSYRKGVIENQAELYVKKAIEYIENNYIYDIKVIDIANYVGLNRSYFFTIFKKHLNIAPQEFLLKYRMDKAYILLNDDKLSIGDIARSVGYKDPLVFSKIFKKVNRVSPKVYRKNLINNIS